MKRLLIAGLIFLFSVGHSFALLGANQSLMLIDRSVAGSNSMVWDPGEKGSTITLSGSDATATNGNTTAATVLADVLLTGKTCWEIEADTASAVIAYFQLGVATRTGDTGWNATYNSEPSLGNDAGGDTLGVTQSTGNPRYSGGWEDNYINDGQLQQPVGSKVNILVYFDADAHKMGLVYDGTDYGFIQSGSSDLVITTGDYYAAISAYNGTLNTYTILTDAQRTQAVPSGYTYKGGI